MYKQHYITAIVLILLTHGVLAHDGEEGITDLDFIIAVVGLIAILGTVFYSFLWNHPGSSRFDKTDLDSE